MITKIKIINNIYFLKTFLLCNIHYQIKYFWFIIAYILSVSKMMIKRLTMETIQNSILVKKETENRKQYVGGNN